MDLSQSDLTNVVLKNACLNGANLSGAWMALSLFENTDFTGADLDTATITTAINNSQMSGSWWMANGVDLWGPLSEKHQARLDNVAVPAETKDHEWAVQTRRHGGPDQKNWR